MHSMHGNGPRSAEGKGKKGKNRPVGKGGPPSTSTPELVPASEFDDTDLLDQIRAALPQAAVIRAQSTLDNNEWNVPIVSPQLLDGRGGIALCPRQLLPSVLQRVGFTTLATGILTSQPAQDLGMRGYPQQRVQCSIFALNDQGERVRVEVLRWLIQLSYGQHVKQVFTGPQVDLFTTMRPFVVKFPARFGWPEKIPANLVATELQKHVPQECFQ